ncbi:MULTISPECIES: DUF6776 family protein [unclassified Undibacterium]|uniref:DUF6776 family protein n=1 Tax=unclassified Undibacterium TaxID=2630295 RepID=UPI002AC8E76B|nr:MULTISPECIES: DUF6776 family protein [unclassified Undibacterium]MEB0137939.1 hypothetical protein [Undibacterium sp. CCC2.1]MEB0172059.1 hypothetical protein [Undibacterium sp. CCC1.1]MEB0174947.1 hypothetical protein [Undibacterium sp. CCC3.4]MEB0214845.1 hypothetical protein [Undibacterium sp. 5I2]WPX45391.1 hypothetical protein RHM61_09325 [Undibacterium sp. CCC3.4]
MTISHQQPWHIKLMLSALVIGVAAAVAWWTYDMGRSFAFGPQIQPDQVQALQAELSELRLERDKLSLSANTIESKLNIDHSMQKELAEQVKTLMMENQKLKDDLAFFEGLIPAVNGSEGVAVQNLKVEMQAPGQLRYRALVMQGVKNPHDFNGELQLSLSLVQAGKAVTMQFPDPKSGEAGKLKLSFKHYQRLEGVITLPDGAIAKTVQVKVLDRGQIRAQQAVNL